ncbi:MAG: hypothetical protein NFCOHLIN_02514 [Gammaproteobacteria bacterium]|nr:hypothetical protein [Gammaproteobacteria bacterium]
MPTTPPDPYNLQRFVAAQEASYAQALAELREGRKRTHWIWYVLPQIEGLGTSAISRRYAIGSLAEARAYLAHPILGPRLRECVAAVNAHGGISAVQIFGSVDAAKFRSCCTLFAEVAGENSQFAEALNKYFAGRPDPATLAILAARRGRGEA